MYRILRIFVLLNVFFCFQAKAQEPMSRQDSMAVKTAAGYKAIENFSNKTKFTKFLHQLLFKSVAPVSVPKPKNVKAKKTVFYLKAEGKIIRNINILTLDPFGYSIQDTSVHPKGFIKKAVNDLHFKTRRMIIRNLLLFNENQAYDSLLVNESERIIRAQNYVRDVFVSSLPTSAKADSVDVFIRVSDVWSIVPALSLSGSSSELGLIDNNFIGLGNRFQANIKSNKAIGNSVTRMGYLIPNIRNTFISANIRYYFSGNNDLINNTYFRRPVYPPISSNLENLISGDHYLVKSFELSRLFYSPLAKWAGGVFFGQLVTDQSYIQHDTIGYLSSKTNIQDYWAARSWQLFKGNTADARTTSFILSGRLLRVRYPQKPSEAEPLNIFNNATFYFGGIGVSSRRYTQDKYILNYGKVEDVPIGRAFGITGGMNMQRTNLWYLGLKAAWGNFYRFGYLSSHLEYGTFIGSKGIQQEVITGRINYFTQLYSLGNWKIRQFVKPTFTIGFNRLPTDNLTFSDDLKGFGKLKYSATYMSVLTLQTQSYAPWDLFGFRFGPYFFSSFGILGNGSPKIAHSRLYSVLGLGVLIKNDYLMFNTFQISLSFYPIIPGQGSNILNLNAYKTSDYGFRDFEISKPVVVGYR